MNSKAFKAKPKSAHDIGDPSLLSKPIQKPDSSDSSDSSESNDEEGEQVGEKPSVNLDSIKSKLKKKAVESASSVTSSIDKSTAKLSDREIKKKATQEEIKRIQRELAGKDKAENDRKEVLKEKKEEAEVVVKYKEDINKYEHLKKKLDTATKKSKSKEDKVILFQGLVFSLSLFILIGLINLRLWSC